MRLAPEFDNLEVGEVDNFCFNLTAEVGDASISYALWTCSLQSNQPGTDPDPQSRVIALLNPTSLDVKLPNDTIQTLYGNFAVAQVGPCPASAAGCVYVLGAQAYLSDGRIIGNNSIFKCVLPGEF